MSIGMTAPYAFRFVRSNSHIVKPKEGERVKAEDKYKNQLVELDVYQPAFDAEIHTLCMMERELRREQKEWREGKKELDETRQYVKLYGSSDTKKNDLASLLKTIDAHYALIMQLRRDILSHRDALGLTPKGLQRLRGKDSPAVGPAGSAMQTVGGVLEALQDKVSAYDK